MSFWTKLRDAVEGGAAAAVNYVLPGSGIVTQNLVSKGAQAGLESPLGKLAMLGGGIAGSVAGNVNNYGNLWDAATGNTTANFAANGYPDLTGTGSDFVGPPGNLAQGVSDPAGFMGGLSPQDAAATGPIVSSPWDSLINGIKSAGSSLLPSPSSSGSPVTGTGATSGGNQGVGWTSPSTLMSLASGLYGLSQSEKQKQLALAQSQLMDPFASSRPQYVGRLNALMADPSSITSTPGYEAGLQAVQRSMASQGYGGSGNMMHAVQKYGGDFYNQEVARLMALSGANAAPGAGAGLAVSGTANANELAGKSLASLGYGTQLATGGSNSLMNPQLLALLMKQQTPGG